MKDHIVYNRKTGQLGLMRNLGEAGFKDKGWGDGTKEWGSNHAILLLDPVDLTWDIRKRVSCSTEWRALPDSDPRVQFLSLFEVIEKADWHYDINSDDEDAEVEYAEIENPHEIFRLIRKIFEAK